MIRTFIIFTALILLVSSCGTPNDPADYSGGYTIVAKMTTPASANDIVIDGDYAYLAQGEGGLLIAGISDPAHPQIVSMENEGVRGYSSKIIKKDNTVYLTAGSFGLSVVNVEDIQNPEVTVSNLAIKPSKNLYVFGDYLLTAIGERGFKMAYIGNPNIPDIRGETNTDGYAYDAKTFAGDTYVMVATGEVGMAIYDISSFDDGYGIYPLTGSCDLPGKAESFALDEATHTAYFACGNAGVALVDYSDVNHPHLTDILDTGGYAKEILYEQGMVYVTTGRGGLHIWDVSGSTPVETGIVDTGDALGLTAKGDYLYIADAEEGLIVVQKP